MIYLNGQFMPIEEARVPVLDRGFIFGDGVYEVIPVYSRHAFRLQEHLRRLQASLDAIRLPNPHDAAEWTRLLHKLIELNEIMVSMPMRSSTAFRSTACAKFISPATAIAAATSSTRTMRRSSTRSGICMPPQ